MRREGAVRPQRHVRRGRAPGLGEAQRGAGRPDQDADEAGPDGPSGVRLEIANSPRPWGSLGILKKDFSIPGLDQAPRRSKRAAHGPRPERSSAQAPDFGAGGGGGGAGHGGDG